ncbi:hypothetical protein ASPCAL14749 [Aspergillus calidoustus]|uniref:Uncharacterized protein n=1 Tax=Aspergillus calidoustus TaxID=454130 RepID=A0A0U5GGW9_ASPCI|nr:hypothetical protein ASPCAL14749 [Aspergillus calidoustus]
MSELCVSQIQSPLDTGIHLLVNLFVAASYIPQLIHIRTSNTGDAGISGWYIILLTTSTTSHCATRIRNLTSSTVWSCSCHGELKGFGLFSALVVHLQAFTHWAAAIILLAFYVSFRTQTLAPQNDTKGAGPALTTTTTSSPRNITILAIVLTHAAVVLPLAIYLLIPLLHDEDDYVQPFFNNFLYGCLLRLIGILTSLTAAIPQIHLMVTRYYNNGNTFDPSSLSLLSLGLQAAMFIALSAPQGWRMRPEGVEIISLEWWLDFFLVSGLAAGWVALAVCQLLVLCVALGLRAREGRIRL